MTGVVAVKREDWLDEELEEIRRRGLERQLEHRIGKPELDFTSNDYLGLASDPRVVDAAAEAARRYGGGGRAARLLNGGSPLDHEVEQRVAEWLSAESALLFPTGYQANLGLLSSIAGAGDLIFSDALNHASIIDACRLSRGEVSVYGHVDCEHLREQLVAASGARRRFVVTESIFSMDGDCAPLAELAELCLRLDAHLIVDEAHAVGVVGDEIGSGAWDASDADARALLARVVTGGKALGSGGGLVVGSRRLCHFLANRARSFIFTTGVAPAVSGALLTAVELAQSASAQRRRIRSLSALITDGLGLPRMKAGVIPVVVGEAAAAMEMARRLTERGLRVAAVRPPTVPHGTSRLRLVVHAHNSEAAVGSLLAALRQGRVRKAAS